jgi:hypothetical protein
MSKSKASMSYESQLKDELMIVLDFSSSYSMNSNLSGFMEATPADQHQLPPYSAAKDGGTLPVVNGGTRPNGSLNSIAASGQPSQWYVLLRPRLVWEQMLIYI